jgi:hypothetical protein
MECKNCFKVCVKRVIHKEDEVCPLSKYIVCLTCNMRGHFREECIYKKRHLYRPTYLEDLIPYELKKIYGIKTFTPIDYGGRSIDKDKVLLINTIVVKNDNKSIQTMLSHYDLKVDESYETNVHTLSEYAKNNGMKIIFKHV